MNLKRLIVITGFFVLGMAAMAQDKAKELLIEGRFETSGTPPQKIMIDYMSLAGRRVFDSVKVNNGCFKIEREMSEPVLAIFFFKANTASAAGRGQQSQQIYNAFLLPGHAEMIIKDGFKTITLSGPAARANEDYQVFNRKADLSVETHNRLVPPLFTSIKDEKIRDKHVKAVEDSLNMVRDRDLYLATAERNPRSPVAVLAFIKYANEPVWRPRKKMEPEKIEQLMAKFPEEYLSYPSLQALKDELKVSKATGIGKQEIDFTLKDTAGRSVSLSDFKGKYVFLDFWASWCVPCRKENPNVKSEYERYKDKGFTVVSVSLDVPGARKAWLDAILKDGIGMWPHLNDDGGFKGAVAQKYYVLSIPTNFLIGPDGTFLGRNLYGEELGKELAKIFGSK